MRSKDVSARLVESMLGPADHPMILTLNYDSAIDPYAVEMVIEVPGESGTVVWSFARDLLRAGCGTRALQGHGDVQIRYIGSNVIEVTLTNPEGRAVFHLKRSEVVIFLRDTFVEMKAGDEDITTQLDEALERMLSS